MSDAASQSAPQVRRVGRVIIALIIAGVLALLMAGGFAVYTLQKSEEANDLVEHTLEVQVALLDLGVKAERGEAARRGYMLRGDPGFRTVWETSDREMADLASQAAAMVADNPEQAERGRRLASLVTELRRLQRQSVAQLDRGERTEAIETFRVDRSAPLLRDVRVARQEMGTIEGQLLEARNSDRRGATNSFYAILAACAVLVFAIIGACVLVIRRYTGALASSSRQLQRLNADLEGAVQERTAELQRANDEIQRFAYIVSHDLRSPLVNVMGFTAELETARKPLAELVAAAEVEAPGLVTREAKMAVDEDLPEAVRFIRTSTEKMDRLINAILRLSREGRRNLAPEALAMTELVTRAADGLRHRADELGAEIHVDTLPDLHSDRVAIEQIFSNLLENAVKYLQPGRPGRITVSGHRHAGRLIYDVADNGRGIDPRDHQRVFDLFRRSGTQDQPGEGIGLAHVRSLVWRLGGTIEVESELDGGATFRLSLPASPTGEEAS